MPYAPKLAFIDSARLKMNSNFEQRADRDFIQRAMPGLLIYILVWPLMIFGTDFYKHEPQISWNFTCAFYLISGLRYIHGGWGMKYYDNYKKAWQRILWVLVMCHALIWSYLFTCSFTDPRFAELSVAVNLVTTAIAIASMASLIPKFYLAQLYVAILLLPTTFSFLFFPQLHYLFALFMIYWGYLVLMGIRFNQEYKRAFVNESELHEKQLELELISKTDSLTRVYNRHYFAEQITYQWNLAIRNRSELAIMIIDIDHFKSINDTYGHVVGDGCLMHLAQVIRKSAKRSTDMVVRYGGEEFVVILPTAQVAACQALAETIRHNIEQSPFVQEPLNLSLTASIGLCVMAPSVNTEHTELLHRADSALYQAKASGRNKVQLAK
jgi:diguanylate cyclase (GGDEF)-like protein